MDDYDLADDLMEKKTVSNLEIIKNIIFKNEDFSKINNINVEELIKITQHLEINEYYYLNYNIENCITQNFLLTEDLLYLKKIFESYEKKIKLKKIYSMYYNTIKKNYFISFKYLTNILEYNTSIETQCYTYKAIYFLQYLLSLNKIKLNSVTFFKSVYFNCYDFLKILHDKKCPSDMEQFIPCFISFDCFKFLNINNYDLKNNISKNYLLQIINSFDYEYYVYYIDNGYEYDYEYIYVYLNKYYMAFYNYLIRIPKTTKTIDINDNKYFIFDYIYYFMYAHVEFSTTTDIKNFYMQYLNFIDAKPNNVENLKNIVVLLLNMKNYLIDNTKNPIILDEEKKII